jgi:hypothetical protein
MQGAVFLDGFLPLVGQLSKCAFFVGRQRTLLIWRTGIELESVPEGLKSLRLTSFLQFINKVHLKFVSW